VTTDSDNKAPDLSELRPSLLPFDPAQLTAVRVRPAEFARLCKVSKQAVSQWIRKGTISLEPDGRLDPALAARQVFERSDPAKIRARVFKTASMSMDALRAELAAARARIAEVEAELACEREFRARCTIHQDDLAGHLYRLETVILESFHALVAASVEGNLGHAIERLVSLEFYGTEPEPEEPEPLEVPPPERDLFQPGWESDAP
jgi:hypothetical protein